MPKRKLKVFLSHAPNDETAAYQLYEQLAAEGWIDVWLAAESVLDGQNSSQEIEKAINASELAIVCISQSSTTQQGSVQRELRLVLEMAQNMPDGVIYIVPLKLEECEPPFLLRHLRFANYFEGERQKGYQRLLLSLRKRAEGLGISITARPALEHPRATAESNMQGSRPFEDSGRNARFASGAQGNIVITGDNNKIYLSGQPENDPTDQSETRTSE